MADFGRFDLDPFLSSSVTALNNLTFLLQRKSDSFHRLSQMKAEDEEEVLRVPIILAAVKLLQALPERALHLHLPG